MKNNKLSKGIIFISLSAVLLTVLICILVMHRSKKPSAPISATVSLGNCELSDTVSIDAAKDNTATDTITSNNISVTPGPALNADSDITASENVTLSSDTALSEDTVVSENTTQPLLTSASKEDITDEYEMIPSGTIIAAENLTQGSIDNYFRYYPVPDDILQKMNGKSYRENNDISIDDLRYVKVLHYNFNHDIQVGELIVNKSIADDTVTIFRELFDCEYEIQSMYLVDRYWTGDGDSTDSASIEVNNTSCFLYRNATNSSKLSKHALGKAIDINPQQNPYVSYKSGSPVWSHENANDYIDRSTGLPHVITHEDACYKIFVAHGFTWGGDWNSIKDYQHFEKN